MEKVVIIVVVVIIAAAAAQFICSWVKSWFLPKIQCLWIGKKEEGEKTTKVSFQISSCYLFMRLAVYSHSFPTFLSVSLPVSIAFLWSHIFLLAGPEQSQNYLVRLTTSPPTLWCSTQVAFPEDISLQCQHDKLFIEICVQLPFVDDFWLHSEKICIQTTWHAELK